MLKSKIGTEAPAISHDVLANRRIKPTYIHPNSLQGCIKAVYPKIEKIITATDITLKKVSGDEAYFKTK
jgi:hypothetical protein